MVFIWAYLLFTIVNEMQPDITNCVVRYIYKGSVTGIAGWTAWPLQAICTAYYRTSCVTNCSHRFLSTMPHTLTHHNHRYSHTWNLNCICVCVFVCMFMCMFAYSSRMDAPICTKLGMLMPWDQEQILERSKLRNIVLSSSQGNGGSCSSEHKHDRRTTPRPNMSVSTRRLQEQRPQSRKTVLDSSSDEDIFCTLETNNGKT
jgi:hypothetical protein